METGRETNPALTTAEVLVSRDGRQRKETDLIAREVPVAFVYNGISHAVMMASPADLEDFALGFSLTEGIIDAPDELFGVDVQWTEQGISLEMHIDGRRFSELRAFRRSMTGRTGCGLCGTESLEYAIRPSRPVSRATVPSDHAIQDALDGLRRFQPLQGHTGATHGAAWCDDRGEIVLAREDVGRHNAVDKLVGARLRRGGAEGTGLEVGFMLVSSRASYEIVQKCAAAQIGCLVAVSAPTALAVEHARAAGITLVAFARPGRHVFYNLPDAED